MTAPNTSPEPSASHACTDASAQRAAIVMLLLDEGDAAALLTRLEPAELRHLATAMCAIEDVDASALAAALDGFVDEADRQALPGTARQLQVEQLITRAVGAPKADSLMRQVGSQGSGRSLEIARWLTPESLLQLAADEPAEVVAVLLLLLDPEVAAGLLVLLPSDLQARVVEHVASLDAVPAPAEELLGALLEERLAERLGTAALTTSGPRDAAELINRAAGGVAGQVLPAIAARDAALAGAIEEELVTFAMLQRLDAPAMGRLLREVDNAVLVDALKGLGDDERQAFFAAMSSRAADGVREEIEARGRVPKAEVDRARRTLVTTARALADAGELVLVDGDDRYL